MKEEIDVIDKGNNYDRVVRYVSDVVPREKEEITVHDDGVVRDYRVVGVRHQLRKDENSTIDHGNLVCVTVFVYQNT